MSGPLMVNSEESVQLKSSRANTVMVLFILSWLITLLAVPFAMVIRAFCHGGANGRLYLSAAIIIAPIIAALLLMARSVVQLIVPDIPNVSASGVSYASPFRKFEYKWREVEPLKLDIRRTFKGDRSYYTNFVAKDGSRRSEIFLGGFGHDYNDALRVLSAAQEGRIIDLGDPWLGPLLLRIVPVLALELFTLWWVVAMVRDLI
jgi:hypothetical protein